MTIISRPGRGVADALATRTARPADRSGPQLETGRPPGLEGRFKDGRDRTSGPRPETGDLRRQPRGEPRSTKHRAQAGTRLKGSPS